MRKIKLGNSIKYVLVDNQDYDKVSQFNWSLVTKGYAITGGRGATMAMHRFILGLVKEDKIEVDHVNGNKLDNRKSNLRLATPSQNRWNTTKRKHNTSGYKGVYYHYGKWQARIGINYREITLGTFNKPEKAAEAYNDAARVLHGEFAKLNILDY